MRIAGFSRLKPAAVRRRQDHRGLNTVLKNSRNHQPQMNADERRWKTKDVSVYIGVYRRSWAA